MSQVNRRWLLVEHPVGRLDPSHFTLHEEKIRELGEGEILIRNIYLSLDPTNRLWADARESYMPPVETGEVMRGLIIGVVEESRNPAIKEGDIVQGILGWEEYVISDGTNVSVIPYDGAVPLSAFFGLFSHTGLAAYFGLEDIGKPKEGETLVVSAAAGAVGSVAGQIGKIKGCRVVGIAGTDEKCRWIRDDLGFDASINYKTESVQDSLKEHCPDGIDIYFDAVGGKILDAVLAQINFKARIAICGMISQYNSSEPVPGPYNFINILYKSARVEGFIVLNYAERFGEGINDLVRWYSEGKLKYHIDIVDGLENAPTALNKLFKGTNTGKLIVKVSEEPSI